MYHNLAPALAARSESVGVVSLGKPLGFLYYPIYFCIPRAYCKYQQAAFSQIPQSSLRFDIGSVKPFLVSVLESWRESMLSAHNCRAWWARVSGHNAVACPPEKGHKDLLTTTWLEDPETKTKESVERNNGFCLTFWETFWPARAGVNTWHTTA